MGSAESKTDGIESCPVNLNDDFTRRIVVLGKTGAGKSSLINTLFGESVCKPDNTATSGTSKCQAVLKTVHGRSIKLIDTPGFFDTREPEEKMKEEIVKCITECAPGPHVFIIALKVEKYTKHEKEIINKMTDYFSDEALKFATVLFTHGDQLPEGMKIDQYVAESEDLSIVVKKCGNRCNVIDNKYWKNSQDEYRSNEFQVKELLNTMDKICKANRGGFYTNKMLQELKRDLEEQQESIKQASNVSPQETAQKAKAAVTENLLLKMTGITTGALLGGFLGGGLKLMTQEGPKVALVVGVAMGVAAGVAAAADAAGITGPSSSAELKTVEHQETKAAFPK